jgi:hypothetical protein
MVNVYYSNNPIYRTLVSLSKVSKQDFLRMPLNFDEKLSPDDIFKIFYTKKNPLTSSENQSWLEENLLDNFHTSISNGDILEYRNRMVMLTLRGWIDISWK